MMDKKNFVTCQNCSHWSDESRVDNLCKRCNNSKLVLNPKDLLCNMCGGNMCHENAQYPQGLFNISVSGGFGSYYLFDCTSYIFSLCEKCLRKSFNEFIIKPKVFESGCWYDYENDIHKNDIPWEEDQKMYEDRLWVDSGGPHKAYLNNKCNVIRDCSNDALYTIFINDKFTEKCCCAEHEDLRPFSSKLVKFIPNKLKAFL